MILYIRCIQWFKDTNLKANHNMEMSDNYWNEAVFNGSKILIWKQITTRCIRIWSSDSCIQWFKDTNLKANHNEADGCRSWPWAVFNGSKILIWKQITTIRFTYLCNFSCIQWFKDTNLKANHNFHSSFSTQKPAVFNGSKILIWKQITTGKGWRIIACGCIQWFKDTNLKANHNCIHSIFHMLLAVFNGSKILIWKQITTKSELIECVFLLYSMVQRY